MGKRLGHRVASCAAAVVIAGTVVHVPARAGQAPPPEPTLGPLISGTSSYVGGTFVWTDYAYDDRGPDTDDTAGGDAAYPASMDPNNVADLIQLQLAPAGTGQLGVTAVLETLTDVTRPLLGLALDLDGNPGTGAAALPGSWTASTPLGVDRLFVLGRDGGRELRWQDGRWGGDVTFPVALDAAANTIRAEVPFSLPATGALRAVAALGYDDGNGGSWLSGASAVHDLAFVAAESPVSPYLKSVTDAITGFGGDGEKQWQEYQQSAILAGEADAAPAVAAIDVAAMRGGRTVLAAADTKGFHTFLYKSALRLGEGVEGSGNSAVYNGPYQPYLVWVPEDLRPGLPLVLYLHGSSQTHLSAVNTAHYDAASVDPVLQRPDRIFDFDAVVAWPLGRGPQTWYDGAAELDPLEVTDDVLARLSLDPERVMLAGLSMGGYGTFRLAEHFPDRWSVAYIDVAGDDTGLVENLTSLPVRLQNGVLDPLVTAKELSDGNTDPTPERTRALLDGVGTVDYRSWVLTKGTHAPAVALAECVYLQSFRQPRVKNPAHVRYTADPSTFVDDPATGLRLRYDRAYWVSGLRTTGGRGSVDLTTSALGSVPVPGPTTHSTHENVTSGRDFCGPNEGVTTGDTWTEQAREIGHVPVPVERRVTGSLTGLAAVTVAADRAGVGGRGHSTFALEVREAPGGATLTVTGLQPGATVTNGADRVRANSSGTATIHLRPGPNVVTAA